MSVYIVIGLLAVLNLLQGVRLRKLEMWREAVCDVCETASKGS